MLLDGFWNLEPPEPFVQMLWRSRSPEGGIVLSTTLQLLVRLGRLDEAREIMAATRWDGPQADDVVHLRRRHRPRGGGGGLGCPSVADPARDLLEPMRGRLAVAGISTNFGPVDGYLSLGEAMLGDRSRAAALADAAAAYARVRGGCATSSGWTGGGWRWTSEAVRRSPRRRPVEVRSRARKPASERAVA